MGTTVEVIAYADDATTRVAVDDAFAQFERLQRAFDPFDEASELSHVNASAADAPVEVSPEVFDVVARGLDYCARSQGCFSIALGPLARLWAISAERDRLPTDDDVEDARRRSGFRDVRLDSSDRTISFDTPGMALDLGGLVKGYATDLAREALVRGGVERAYVSAGESSVAVVDQRGGAPYRIGVRHPSDDQRLAGALSVSNGAVSTSGTYERGYVVEGRRFSHLLDPRSFAPVEQTIAATVVCDSGERAEVASKLLLFLGCERGIEACDALCWTVEGATFEPDGAGVRVQYSSGLQIEIFG